MIWAIYTWQISASLTFPYVNHKTSTSIAINAPQITNLHVLFNFAPPSAIEVHYNVS